MRDVQVRPVRVDDERESHARRTRSRTPTLTAGTPITVEINGRWVPCWIVGHAHSELRVSTRPPRGPHRHLTKPEQD